MLLEQFGEQIVYAPRAGGSREITAIVTRDPPAVLDAAGNTVFPRVEIRCNNSCRSGIASNEIDTGRDEILLRLKIGDIEPQRFSIAVMQSQDAGVTVLALV